MKRAEWVRLGLLLLAVLAGSMSCKLGHKVAEELPPGTYCARVTVAGIETQLCFEQHQDGTRTAQTHNHEEDDD